MAYQAFLDPGLEGYLACIVFIPPPRLHGHRYHEVLAPNAGLRAAVIGFGRPQAEIPPAQLLSPGPKSSADAFARSPLQPHSYPLGHSARSDLRGAAASVSRVWWPDEDSRLPHRPTPAFDPIQAESIPDFIFDQSLPADFDD